MPIYEYRCPRCGERLEVLQRLGAGPEGLECPRCGSSGLEREASRFASAGAAGAGCAPRGRFT
jgi:putative FmdB family regulatory protein